MKRILFRNFRIIDETSDCIGSLIVDDGLIAKIIPQSPEQPDTHTDDNSDNTSYDNSYAAIINGAGLLMHMSADDPSSYPVLMPAFIDLHAHFRDAHIYSDVSADGIPFPAETLESASLAAAAGGFATIICMANTKPVIDTVEKAYALKQRCDALGLIDVYPVVSLTKKMDGRELTNISADAVYRPLMLSEDGKDITDTEVFLAAMKQAAGLGIPVSCHCDLGGEENAIRRAIELGKKIGCHVHIAHVSTAESAAIIREAKKENAAAPHSTTPGGFFLSCEATPHHIGANENDANRMGEKSYGRVNPPLRTESDRLAIIEALKDGTIDAIATDHAPHSDADKAAGAPGFSGLETAFAVSLAAIGDLRRFSGLMSAAPARILGLDAGAHARGRIAVGMRADLAIADIHAAWKVDPPQFMSRGKCSPFAGKTLRGKIIMTIRNGRIVYDGGRDA